MLAPQNITPDQARAILVEVYPAMLESFGQDDLAYEADEVLGCDAMRSALITAYPAYLAKIPDDQIAIELNRVVNS